MALRLAIIEDFTGRYNVAGSEKSAVNILLQEYIDTFENEYAKKLLGKELYDEFAAGIIESIPAAKWTALKAKIKTKSINFIYFNYISETASFNTQVGEVKPNVENARIMPPVDRLVRVWNELVDWVYDDFMEWMTDNASDYPNYDASYYCFRTINCFGI